MYHKTFSLNLTREEGRTTKEDKWKFVRKDAKKMASSVSESHVVFYL